MNRGRDLCGRALDSYDCYLNIRLPQLNTRL